MKRVQVNVSDNANIGALNLGKVVGNIETHLTSIHDGSPDLARLSDVLKKLSEAIVASFDVAPEQKRDLLEAVDYLAVAANQAVADRHPGAVRSVIHFLGQGIQASAGLATLWAEFGDQISQFFGC